MKPSFAFIHNQRMPNEFAFGIYVAKSCEATANLDYKTYLVHPLRSQRETWLKHSIWEYYDIPKDSFRLQQIWVPELINAGFLEPIYKHLRQLIMAWTFSFQAVFFTQKHNIQIIQTIDREVIFLLKLMFWYRPWIIYDAHIEPMTGYEKLFDNLMVSRVNQFIYNSEFYKTYYQHKKNNNFRALYLPCGFDPKVFHPKKNRLNLRKKLGIAPNAFVIGFAGRFEILGDEKGLIEMIKAVADLKSQIPIVVMAVGGPKYLLNKYNKIASDLNLTNKEVILLDQVKPHLVSDYIACFDVGCLLYPDTRHYRDKMSPQKAMEFMAMKVPIIASDLPSLRLILPKDYPFLVTPGDQKQLDKMLIKLYKNYKAIFAKLTKDYEYIDQYTWENRQEKILKTYATN